MLRHIIAAILLCVTTCVEDDLRVQTSSGILIGKRGTALGEDFKVFLGVPYATPPVGDLRFKLPLPFNSEGIERDAKEFGATCYQPPHAKDVISPLLNVNEAQPSEDCLFLNIYVPDNRLETSLPVLVWLAGEGFNYADASQFDGKYLSTLGKMIVVTVNYRVGPFGFLSTLHEDAPGNAGLFDQRAALKWIQLNIENFGGDPNRVTLSGRFTGAMSAAIHAFSPLSKSDILFHSVILQSGVPTGDWIFERNPLNSTFELAQSTGCFNTTVVKVLECIKRLPAEDLLKAALNISGAWRPVLDYNLIYEHSLKAAAKFNYNPVKFLMGLNKDEGSICLSALQAMKSEFYEKLIQNTLTKKQFSNLIQRMVADVYRVKNDFLIQQLTSFQYGDYDVTALRDNFIKFCGDIYVKSHTGRLADILSSINHTVFIYELQHRPSFSHQPPFIQSAHGDDVIYSFGLPMSLISLPEEEIALTHQIIQSISNFVYHGSPNSINDTTWPRYNVKDRLLKEFKTLKEKDIKKSTYTEAAIYFHEIVKSARKASCPLPAMASALTGIKETATKAPNQSHIIGTWVTVTTAEYMLLSLAFVSVFLLVVAFVSVITMLKVKHHASFHRLK